MPCLSRLAARRGGKTICETKRSDSARIPLEFLVETIDAPEWSDMTNFDELPRERGVYRVETVSGTVHVLDIAGRTTWERRPGPGATTERYDYSPRVLSRLGPGWEVGRQGFLIVADESYLGGATTHLTATILYITEEPPR